MNRQQAKVWQGKHVMWDYWLDVDNRAVMSGGTVIHAKEVVGTVWILHKLTKGGLCMLGRHGSIETISVAPSCLSQWECVRVYDERPSRGWSFPVVNYRGE